MRYQPKRTTWLAGSVSLAVSLAVIASTPASGAPAASSSPAAAPTLTDLGIMENRFFSRAYTHDPVEKRLERLECMVFGGVQSGSNEDRLSRLMKVVAERAQRPIDKSDPPTRQGAAAQSRPQADSSSQYPVLNTLEWRALKKTYPAETLDQRLDRLESKMFGQPAAGMAYADRVDRLRKTLGIGIDTGVNQDPLTAKIGPAPRARPRGSDSETTPSWAPPGIAPPFSDSGIDRDFGFGFGFPGGMDSIFGATFDKQLHQMMQQMNKHMEEARRLGPGSWQFDPKTNSWVEMNTGRKVQPGESGAPKAAPGPRAYPAPPSVAPPRRPADFTDIVPPYADPNSI